MFGIISRIFEKLIYVHDLLLVVAKQIVGWRNDAQYVINHVIIFVFVAVVHDDYEQHIQNEELVELVRLDALELQVADELVVVVEVDTLDELVAHDEHHHEKMDETVEDDETVLHDILDDEVVDEVVDDEDIEMVEMVEMVEYEIHEHMHMELVEMVEILDYLELVELVVNDDLIEIMVHETVETDLLVELDELVEVVDQLDKVDAVLLNDELVVKRIVIDKHETVEMQLQTFIDSI